MEFHVREPATVKIRDNVVHIIDPGAVITRAMSVRTAQRMVERISRALERYAAGEQDIVED